MQKALVITYSDAEDASCPGDEITAGTFGEMEKRQSEFIEMLQHKGFEVIKVPFDRQDYLAYLKTHGQTDSRDNRSKWAGTRLP